MAKAQILVVEDDGIVVMELRDRLQNLGYAVSSTASYGEEAIKKAGETHPDLVLMDIRLKGDMDGIEAAEQIRTRFDIPVVYLTAHADESTLQRAKLTDPFGYILKPFEERQLRTNIEMALYKHKVEEEREKLARELEDALAQVKMLSGLLPICASCKKIRDDKGYWNQLEIYIQEHSEAVFTHGLCPKCMEELYAELYRDDD